MQSEATPWVRTSPEINALKGRASVHVSYPELGYYDYTYKEEDGIVTSLECTLKEGYDFNEKSGVYFLQTNLDDKDSKVCISSVPYKPKKSVWAQIQAQKKNHLTLKGLHNRPHCNVG